MIGCMRKSVHLFICNAYGMKSAGAANLKNTYADGIQDAM